VASVERPTSNFECNCLRHWRSALDIERLY